MIHVGGRQAWTRSPGERRSSHSHVHIESPVLHLLKRQQRHCLCMHCCCTASARWLHLTLLLHCLFTVVILLTVSLRALALIVQQTFSGEPCSGFLLFEFSQRTPCATCTGAVIIALRFFVRKHFKVTGFCSAGLWQVVQYPKYLVQLLFFLTIIAHRAPGLSGVGSKHVRAAEWLTCSSKPSSYL